MLVFLLFFCWNFVVKTVHKPISDNHCLRCYKAKYAIDPNDRHLRVYASLLMGINIHVLLLVLRLILPILLFFSTFFFQLLLTSCFSSTHNMPYPISFNYNIFSGVAIFFYYSFLRGLLVWHAEKNRGLKLIFVFPISFSLCLYAFLLEFSIFH